MTQVIEPAQDLELDAILSDIRYRFMLMPIEIGVIKPGEIVKMLPHPDDVPWNVDSYGGAREFMQYVRGKRVHFV